MWSDDRTRRYLEDRLMVLEERVVEIERILREPEESDLEEQALDLDDDGVLEGLGRSNRIEIEEIKAALKGLDDGSYGKCSMCERRIGRRRLMVLPHTTTCVRCAGRAA
ncbi:MAG: TraR/DksA family transcriptional regulator [Planctomycetota bacterium]|jgi:RNA polymerase-binding transcription factor DksA